MLSLIIMGVGALLLLAIPAFLFLLALGQTKDY